ncbi:MAG: hypothetical protein ACI35T_07000 [Alistipes sp.]
MEENKLDYEPSTDGGGYDDEQGADVQKSIRGYRVVILLLAVILAGLSALYFNLNRQQQHDYELLKIDRDSIQSNLGALISEYDNLKYTNDTIAANLEKANEMMEQLKRERRWNYAKIKEYQKEVGTLRAVMKTYLRQIDSLNHLNKKLIDENVSYRKEISSANLRADVAEERANELQNKVQLGAVLRARDITLTPLNARGKTVSRVKAATTLRADFTVSANDLAPAGSRTIYLRLTSPDGYLLSTESVPTFSFNGESLGYSASREIDYQNEDVDVGIYYNGSGFVHGDYKVELFCDDALLGSYTATLK